MRRFTRYIFLAVTMFCLGVQAHEGFNDNSITPAPKLLSDLAVASFASVKQAAEADIVNGYRIEWTFKIEYNDDQPILFLFSNEQESCLLEMGSSSFITNSVVCQ